MSELPHDANATIDLTANGSVASVATQFEAAWKKALRGGNQPSIDAYLARVRDADRTTLTDELTRIDADYRRRHAQAVSLVGAAVLNSMPSVPDSQEPDSGTLVHQDVDDADATPNPTGILDTSERPPDGGTIGYMAAPADPSATMEHAPPAADATSADASEPFKRPSKRAVPEIVNVPGYEILGILGRGGMGVVYKAKHLKLKRTVALKMVLAGGHASESDLARFYIEAEAVAQLQHPNIVQVFEISEQNGLPFFALEYVDGGSLSKKLDGKPQPPRDAARMVQTLAEAMAYAHLHGIIHRDLKPANILLAGDGQPKITDFGLAKRLEEDSGQTKSGTLMGTPNYMAPEQARGDTKDVGPLADVYALGVILYQMITGRTPFVGTSLLDTIQQVRNLEPVPPSRLQPKVPADLETICLKCLQKEPQKRYASADDLAEDLRFFLAGEAIRARPVGKAERLWQWCKRNPKVAGLSAAVLALLVTVAVVSSAMWVRVSYEHAEADRARALAVQKAQDEEKARVLADASAKVASEQRKFALETLYKTATTVEEKLRDRADMHDLREDIIAIAMKGLENVSVTPENAAFADRSMGVALQRMGEVGLAVGKTKEAREQFKKTLKIFDHLMVTDPEEDWVPWNAAISLTHLGDISRSLGEPADVARELYLKALKLREELFAHPKKGGPPPPNGPFLRKQALAISYAKLGSLLLVAGDPAGARQDYVKALDLSQELSDAKPDVLQFKQSLAGSCMILADVCFRLRDEAGARRYYDRAIKIREELVQKAPQSTRYQSDVASAYAALGDLDLHVNQPAPALANYEKGHAIHEALAKKDSENVEILSSLSTSFYRLGTARLYMKDQAGADRDYQESLRIKEQLAATDPASAAHKAGIMLGQARLGRHVEAAKVALEMAEKGAKDPSLLFRAACGYALCIDGTVHGKAADAITPTDREQQKHYADAALAALDQAVKLGYADVVALEMDPDLLPLHAYPVYQELLAKVRAKATPSADARRP
ncbi:MAG TPA: serine/threonine-protein kinase [Gemmataceae bacterium]|nr:serine/threonine-protein kinase [Gemmataceae bacterium]